MKTRNCVGQVLLVTALVAASGCGGSGQDDVEQTVQQNLQREIEADDASGRKVEHVTCRDEQSICIARVRTRTGERFMAVKTDDSGAVLDRIDQGEVRPGPVEEGVKRDLQAMLETGGLGGEVTDLRCDEEASRCDAVVNADGEERFMSVLVALDDSDDYAIVTVAVDE